MRKPYLVIAGNHQEFEDWLDSNFKYVGDSNELSKYSPRGVKKILLIGNYTDHPFYWSDDLLRFQIAVAAHTHETGASEATPKSPSRLSRWDRFLLYFGLKGMHA